MSGFGPSPAASRRRRWSKRQRWTMYRVIRLAHLPSSSRPVTLQRTSGPTPDDGAVFPQSGRGARRRRQERPPTGPAGARTGGRVGGGRGRGAGGAGGGGGRGGGGGGGGGPPRPRGRGARGGPPPPPPPRPPPPPGG